MTNNFCIQHWGCWTVNSIESHKKIALIHKILIHLVCSLIEFNCEF